jgi:LmbE family N-acetylglucosaminyl deacetylase
MADTLRLMCVLAHPDDESLGTGGILAKYAAEGVETYLVTATRGEHGWFSTEPYPGPEALGRTREAELREAAAALGLRDVSFLDYVDGYLDQADPAEATARIVAQLRRVRPQVVATFGQEGAYGHPDHIAICQLTSAAVLAAADAGYALPDAAPPHRVSKLYQMAPTAEMGELYESIFGKLVMEIDGVKRGAYALPDWQITTQVDCADHWATVWRAVACHRTQLPNYGVLEGLPEATHRLLWGRQSFYRALSLVNGGRAREHDLFEGLRD